MIVRRVIQPSVLLIAAAGIGLISLGFALLVPDDRRTTVAWLGYAVFLAVFLANFSNILVVRLRSESFDQQIPRLGILWTVDLWFTVLALGGLWAGISLAMPFRVHLMYQLTLLFGLLVVIGLAGFASQQAGLVAVAEQSVSSDLDELRRAVKECESAVTRAGIGLTDESLLLSRISEDVRYLSPCDQPEAVALDSEAASLLRQVSATLSAGDVAGDPNHAAQGALARCHTLLQTRKQQRQV